jgi:hypothetical protein
MASQKHTRHQTAAAKLAAAANAFESAAAEAAGAERVQELRERIEALGCKIVADDLDLIIEDPALGKMNFNPADVAAWCRNRAANAHLVALDAAAWTAGADLAITLLDEAAEIGADELALQDNCREGRPQRTDVFLTSLNQLRSLNRPTSDLAFAAVMTEFLALYADAVDTKLLRAQSRRPILATVGAQASAEVTQSEADAAFDRGMEFLEQSRALARVLYERCEEDGEAGTGTLFSLLVRALKDADDAFMRSAAPSTSGASS